MTERLERIWRIKQSLLDDVLVQEFAASQKLLPLVARLVLTRAGKDPDQALRFLTPTLRDLPDPAHLPNIRAAVERTVQALKNRETIGIHGDYDVDGVSSAAILTHALRRLGATVHAFVPERDRDGYGVSRRGIDELRQAGATLLITSDCGIAACDEVAYAQSQGMEVIVTDHHMPGEKIPAAHAVINPLLAPEQKDVQGLCGSGVAFCFLIALRAALREAGYFQSVTEPDLREYLDLVAVATIADSVPLVGGNRILVSTGLKRLMETQRPGLRALLEVTGLSGKALSATDVAFKIVPRLNVAGRMNQAHKALALLLADQPLEARVLASELDALNGQRREIEGLVRAKALQQIVDNAWQNERAFVLCGEAWHEGVLGIVAARICERFHRPTVVISFSNEKGVGSVRGIEGVDVVEAMRSCESYLVRFGGHRMAAGLTVAADQIAAFREAFSRFMSQQIAEEIFVPHLTHDWEMELAAITPELVDQLSLLQPFGEENPEPLFAVRSAEVIEARVVGETHLKLRIRQGGRVTDAIGFGMGDRLPERATLMDLVFAPQWNEFRGQRTVQLQIKDFKVP